MYAADDERYCIVSCKDDAAAFNGLKEGTVSGKGVINNRMSNVLMAEPEQQGVPTHFVQEISERETLVRRVKIVPLEVIVRNVAAGSLSRRRSLAEGTELTTPVLEFCYKDDALGAPMGNDCHIMALQMCTHEELERISALALQINAFLQERMAKVGLILVDFKIGFGRTPDGQIILADEISPDTCRLWDIVTREKPDKDRFRRNLGNVEEAYIEVARHLRGENGTRFTRGLSAGSARQNVAEIRRINLHTAGERVTICRNRKVL